MPTMPLAIVIPIQAKIISCSGYIQFMVAVFEFGYLSDHLWVGCTSTLNYLIKLAIQRARCASTRIDFDYVFLNIYRWRLL